MALKTLLDWMKLLSGEDKFHNDGTLTVRVYGEDDQSYIVVERELSDSPKVVDQYTIHSLKDNALFCLVCFLKDHNFDAQCLLTALIESNYVEDGMNEITQFEYVEVARYQIQEN